MAVIAVMSLFICHHYHHDIVVTSVSKRINTHVEIVTLSGICMLINIFMYFFSSPAADNYVLVADFVKKFRDGIIRLKENKVTNNLQIRICELDDTMFLGENYRLESWGEVYLSKPTKLEILGLLESSQGMALFPQCIVLVGEERHIYCYRNEVLYLFANSLKELLQDGVPNIDTYYDYPDDISDEV